MIVQLDGITVMTDPSLSEKCGSGGHKRVRKVPCKLEDLSCVDVVLISSDRAEFLDQVTVEKLLSAHPKGHLRWYCGLGVAKTLEQWGCTTVHELDWWDSESFDDITVTFTPAQNWSGRDGWVNQTLWGSWVVQGPSKSFFHVGCTGYCDVFKEIGNVYGPFSIATLPIGGYESLKNPLWYTVTPSEAINIHNQLKSERTIAIRWGTWVLTNEAFYEPKRELERRSVEMVIPPSTFLATRIGRVVKIIEGPRIVNCSNLCNLFSFLCKFTAFPAPFRIVTAFESAIYHSGSIRR